MSIGGPGFSMYLVRILPFCNGCYTLSHTLFWEKACPAQEFLSDMNFLHLLLRVLLHPVPENQIPTLAYHREKGGYHPERCV